MIRFKRLTDYADTGKKKATENDDENRIDDEIEEEQEGERDDSSLREQSYAHMPFELLQFQMV